MVPGAEIVGSEGAQLLSPTWTTQHCQRDADQLFSAPHRRQRGKGLLLQHGPFLLDSEKICPSENNKIVNH